MALDGQRLAALRATKLAALIRATAGTDCDRRAHTDSAVVCCVADGRMYGLARRPTDLGPLLARCRTTSGVEGLTVFVDPADLAGDAAATTAGDLARRASLLTADVEIMVVTGAGTAKAEPTPVLETPEIDDGLWRESAVMADAGARVVDDHGRLVGEVNGLEVARVEPAEGVQPVRLRVGVGQADRELQVFVHGHLDDEERLRRAVEVVATHRRVDAAPHPLNRLARPRWLRSAIVGDPGLVDLTDLEPRPPLRPRPGVADREPAAAYSRVDGVTVVCSAGVDLDLLPEAVDYRARIDPGSKLLVVLPPRDVDVGRRWLDDLATDFEVRAVEPPWPS